uniref:hypothetical protein n=1 Tax=Pantoea ananas TaxID=553 RepID=UPI001B31888D
GFLVFAFGNQSHFSLVVTPVLVISLSLTVNFAAIIFNQCLLPELHKDYETSVVVASYISGIASLSDARSQYICRCHHLGALLQ